MRNAKCSMGFAAILALAAAACGGGGGGGQDTPPLSLLAGDLGGIGNLNGAGRAARFALPSGVVTDRARNIYVADADNHAIRRVTPAGVVTVFAGTPGESGQADGTGPGARFDFPIGMAFDRDGNLLVADTNNHTIRRITPEGVVTTLAGAADASGNVNGTGANARFSSPTGLAVDSGGIVYVADTGNAVIRRISLAGAVTRLATSSGQFDQPFGLAVDSEDNLFVADSGRHVIFAMDPDVATPAGVAIDVFAGDLDESGSQDGQDTNARFFAPSGIAIDAADNIFVADTGNGTIRRITPSKVVTTIAGSDTERGNADGVAGEARFMQPLGLALDGAGDLFVSDSANCTLRRLALSTAEVTTLAGAPFRAGLVNATGAAARFSGPGDVAVDARGNVYVADNGNDAIRRVTPAGAATTFAASPQLDFLRGLALDRAGNVYASSRNSTILLVTTQGTVTLLAGSADNPGTADGVGSSARFSSPAQVAVDAEGLVYVADEENHAIRTITAQGEVVTLAGTFSEGQADGNGATAGFESPEGVAVDQAGVVYVADTGNHTIRRITSANGVTTVSTLAGLPDTPGNSDGAGSVARFNSPRRLAVDDSGNVYVADVGNHLIRRVTPAGVVTTVAGTRGQFGFRAGPLPGVIANPQGVTSFGSELLISFSNGIARAEQQ